MTFLFRGSGANLEIPKDDGPSKLSASYRDGKFRKLSEFMQVDDNDQSLHEGYKRIGFTNVRPGLIIHVSDEKSRLDRRVMLVLRKSTMSFMCLTFCSHWPPPSPEDHWRVCEEGKAKAPGEDPKMQPLEIVLQPHGRASPKVSPEGGVTINIQDIWNVENEVNVKVLGEATSSSLPSLAKAVKQRFCANLDEAVPQPDVVSRENTERRYSKNSETRPKKYFVMEKKRSGS